MKKILFFIIIINISYADNEKLKGNSCNIESPETYFAKALFLHRKSEKEINKNINKIIKLYKKACIANYARACHNLGVLYHCHSNKLTIENYEEIIKLYDKACLLNNLLPNDSYLKSDSLSCQLSKNLKKYKELNGVFPSNDKSSKCSQKIHKIIHLFSSRI